MGEAAMDGSPVAGGMVMDNLLKANARDLELELAWLARLLDARFKSYFHEEADAEDVLSIPPPDLGGSDSPYARCVCGLGLGLPERAALALSLAPHLRPQLLDVFFYKNQTFDRRFSEFGGCFLTWLPALPCRHCLTMIMCLPNTISSA